MPVDAGRADATAPIPGEIRTLHVGDNAFIGELAVDSHNNLCALVGASDASFRTREMHYGCFDASGVFVRRALIATGFASGRNLMLDWEDNPSMIVGAFDERSEVIIGGNRLINGAGSCAVGVERDVVWSACVEQPFVITSFAHHGGPNPIAAVILNESGPGMLGSLEVGRGIYLARGLPVTERSQLHRFTEGDIGPNVIFAAEDGGWFVGGSYSTAPPAWMLPESPHALTPFWARLDHALNPVEAHAYLENAGAGSWSLGRDGRLIGIASSPGAAIESPRPSYFVGEGFETWTRFGQAGSVSVAASRNTIAAMLHFSQGPITVGALTFEGTSADSQVVATFTRSGELLTARQVPGYSSNVVLFADESVAYSDGNVVHVLSSR